ncbi:hypothetical protein EDB89DRAFT_2075508 [Lactarius sanguifluus]|nr:hypothetical protein EDB89DRAFT_2075508 [Lactarius sanguifluus]
MAPSTRCSRLIAAKITAALSHTNGAPSENVLDSQSPDHTSTSTQRAAVNQNNPDLSGIRTTRGKHTFVSSDTATAPSPTPVPTEALQGIPSKRARVTGPVNVRPMPLQLPSEGGIMGAPASNGVMKGKRVGLRRTSSFYPSRSDMTHPLASLQVNSGDHDSDPNDDDIEDEDDWLEDEQTVNVTRKVSAKMAEVTMTERPSWLGVDATPPGVMQTPSRNVLDVDTSGSATGHESASSTPRPRLQSELGAPTVELLATATTLQTEATTESSGVTWPTDTELLPPGASKLLLTGQQSLVRNVVQESIENVQASLMFSHTFPDGTLALTFIKDGLINAAEKHKPGAADIKRRLEQDQDYLTKISQLPRARIPLIRSDVKDCCAAFCVPPLVAIGSTNGIAQVVCQQLSAFNYTFPTKRFLVGIPQHTHPYRNECIIAVIRELFFTGGQKSFSSHFDHLFPVHQRLDGTSSREVPVPMVALVATAMYATLNEWRTGKSQVLEFSANTYLDVSGSTYDDSPGVEIVKLDLDDLEG